MNDTMHSGKRRGLPSGRFVVRIDPGLHALLRGSAKVAGTSLNEYCARKLSLPAAEPKGPVMEAVTRVSSLLGDTLLGVVAFGSWARQTMGEGSDVDLLIVVGRTRKIDRGLYRRWDETPVRWDGHPVEPHFVHLPEEGDRLSGLWAEVAVDGIVLYDRDLTVSRRLVTFRRIIASGTVHRGHAHGQAYWVGVT